SVLSGNVFVLGNRTNGASGNTPVGNGPWYVIYNNQLAGTAVPNMGTSTNNNNDVFLGPSVNNIAAGAGADRRAITLAGTQGVSSTTPGVSPLLLNGGLIGVGTDVLTTGGVTIWGVGHPQNAAFDSQ